ncbi:MAG: hypothetical protein U1E05_17405, partial [Patescibacteria group bacterium]|nr:hypothetical protein [Patescibacteria group bacterium]
RLTAERQELQRELNVRVEAAEAATRAAAGVESAWRDAWRAIGIEPLSPREMRSWLNQQRALVSLAEGIRKQRAVVGDLEGSLHRLRDELRQCLQPLGRNLADDRPTLAQAVECAESLADEIESANQRREQFEKDLEKLHLALHDARHDVEQANNDLARWEADWEEAVAALGLERDARPAEANAVMDALDELSRSRKEVSELQGRIEGIDRDAAEFTNSVRQLTGQVAADLMALPAERAVADLYDRLEAAGMAQTKLDGWNEQRDVEQAKMERACSQAEQLDRELDAMCREAGCTSPDELPAVEQRSAARRDLQRQWASATQRLTELAANAPLDAFMGEAEQFDQDRLEADLQCLAHRVAELETDLKTVAEEVGSHRNELRRMDGSDRAAAAQEQVESLLACVRADVEQYVRLRLAGAVLRRAVERFRTASQGPVLDRASDWFAALTLGSFSGLRADYDDKGSAVLMGIRAGSGQAVGVEGMSGGTCDQLYLALRLTLLETYLNAHEPLPFILDDILVMFDDGRAIAALKALAQLADRTQVIFFTHHEHLLSLARDHLGPGTVTLHSLTPPPR